MDVAAADGKAPSWTQCRKRIRKETAIGGGNERLKESYDRVAAWFAAGGPDRPDPPPADRPDRPVHESVDRPGPLGWTALDRPVRTPGPNGPKPYRRTARSGPLSWTASAPGPRTGPAAAPRTGPAPSGDDDDDPPRGRIAFRDGMPDGAHAAGCTLAAEHRGPCWIPEPPPEPLTDGEHAALERLPRVPAIVNGDTPAVRRYNAVRAALGLAPVSLDAQPDDREALDASAFFDRLAETCASTPTGAGLPGAVA